ncbi:MAG: hypothetical protein R2795_06785 [Saprospiraceae bacterium]
MERCCHCPSAVLQIWQWIRHGAHLDDGRHIDYPLFRQLLEEELQKMPAYLPAQNRLAEAVALFDNLVQATTTEDFLTLNLTH